MQGNPNDVAEILEQTSWLRSLARQLVRDPHTADDVVQSTIVAALAWEELPREGLRNWLAGVARNMARQISRGERRRDRRHERAAVPEALPSTAEMAEVVETQRTLAASVLDLPEHYRQVVFLRYFEELTPSEIARRLDIPASTVRVRLMRGLDLLRDRLQSEYADADRHWSLYLLPLATPRGSGSGTPAPLAGGAELSTITGGGVLKLALVSAVSAGAIALLWPEPEDSSSPSGPAAVLSLDTTETRGRVAPPVNLPPTRLGDGRTAAAATDSAEDEPLALEGGAIVGRVLDGSGAPVAGAEVWTIDGRRHAPEVLELTPSTPDLPVARTRSDGSFRLEVLPDHPFLLRASAPGLADAESPRTFAGERRDLTLTAGGSLALVAIDAATQEQISGARLQIASVHPHAVPTAWTREGLTDDDGSVRFEALPAGPITITAVRDGYAHQEWRSELDGRSDSAQELGLREATSIRGVVLVKDSEAPVADARVVGPSGETTTDALGRFELAGLPRGEDRPIGIVVWARGHEPSAAYVRLSAVGDQPYVTFELVPPTIVTGRVVDSFRRPLTGIEVGYRGRFMHVPGKQERQDGSVLTNADGRFHMELHHRAAYTIGAEADGLPLVITRVNTERDGDSPIDVGEFVLAKGARVSGRVHGRTYDRERPDTLEFSRIAYGDSSILGAPLTLLVIPVQPDGSFEAASIAPGRYEVTLHAPHPDGSSKELVLARRRISLEAGQALEDVELTPVEPIQGRIALVDGSPMHRAMVELRATPDGEPLVRALTDREGRYELRPPPGSAWTLVPIDPDQLREGRAREDIDAGTSNVDFVLRHRETPHSLSGRVVDERGRPIAGVEIRLTDERTRMLLRRRGETDADGRFELKDLDESTFTVRAVDPQTLHKSAAQRSVSTGDEPIELRLESLD